MSKSPSIELTISRKEKIIHITAANVTIHLDRFEVLELIDVLKAYADLLAPPPIPLGQGKIYCPKMPRN